MAGEPKEPARGRGPSTPPRELLAVTSLLPLWLSCSCLFLRLQILAKAARKSCLTAASGAAGGDGEAWVGEGRGGTQVQASLGLDEGDVVPDPSTGDPSGP